MNRMCEYFRGLTGELGRGWNQFWFSPSDGFDLCVIRIPVGILVLLWQLSFTPDLIRWFGPHGWFDGGVLAKWLTAESILGFSGRLSFLFNPSPNTLWLLHGLSSLVLLAFIFGFFTRTTAVLSFVVVLSYIHRAPFLGSATEVVISMLVGYLCLAPCGRSLSIDARRRGARFGAIELSVWSTIARRLLQVHIVAIYAIMALSKLGAATWWNGEAVWWLSAQPLSRDLDLTFLRQTPIVLNLWTYAILISEFAFALFIWNRWLRPLLIGVSTVSWISLAIATGSLALPVTMIVANLAFVPSQSWRELLVSRRAEPVPVEDAGAAQTG